MGTIIDLTHQWDSTFDMALPIWKDTFRGVQWIQGSTKNLIDYHEQRGHEVANASEVEALSYRPRTACVLKLIFTFILKKMPIL